MRYVIPEGYGILEISHVLIPLLGVFVAVRLLFRPFVKARPLVLAVALIGAMSCLYIAGEEASWGQHYFHWGTPAYWAEINRQEETNLHNTYDIFEKTPRLILQVCIFVGGLLIPFAAVFVPRLRANRMALFLPAAALVPTALGVMTFMIAEMLHKGGITGALIRRPSETVETYLYFFILAFLIVYARRIGELEGSSDRTAR